MSGAGTMAGTELRPGDCLGVYRLEAVLGEGAMGIVYRAVREPDGPTVALKVLRRELNDPVFRQRFMHEARAASEVRHNHLVGIVEAGEADGRPYLAHHYIDGRSLDRCIAEGPLSLEQTLRVAAETASALDALHQRGLVHRDVKPSNILLDEEGTVYLADFGLAKGPGYTRLTQPRQVLGTLDYLAPELIRGEPATAISDVYALGCVTFECLAGKPPFGGKSMLEVGMAHLGEIPPDPCEARTDLGGAGPSLSWAILRSLEKDPAKRPPSATAYASMLRVAASPRGR